nr:asparaginase [Galbitalea soli]
MTAAGCVELAQLERSELIESRHLGAAVVVDADGALVTALGDPAALVYPRSTLKPVQATAVLRAGLPLDGEELVLASASHAGSPQHLAVVRRILASAGLDETALQCPADWPLGREYRDELVRAGLGPSRLHMNCSGKHAAFLAVCAWRGWDVAGYLEGGHPLQQLVRETIQDFTGEPVLHSGVDGCGAPVHAVSLVGLARATGRVTGAAEGPQARVAAAIRRHPWGIDGHGRANTVVIQELGLIAKLGAEGVMVMGAPDGRAVAVKVLDGSLRAATIVALELLVRVGAVDRDRAAGVAAQTTERVLGGGHPVGRLSVAF